MGCHVSYEYRRKYPNNLYMMWISDPTGNDPQSYSGIADTNIGALDLLEKMGQGVTSPGEKKVQAAPNPYTTQLMPITDDRRVYDKQKIFLEKIEIFPIDTTLTGSANQTAGVLTEIYNSKATDDAYAQSLYRHSPVNFWQPNFCRPEFWIDGRNYLDGFQNALSGSINKGIMSIGIPLPFCFDVNMELNQVKEIKAYGQLAQIVALAGPTYYYQRYGLQVLATFWTGYRDI